MRIAIDIDGTICELRKGEEAYADVAPLPGAVEKIRALKAAGHYLILLTARHMKTCNGNVGLVIARQGPTLFAWLEKHGIPYDEVWFGKPHADVYIDDNGLRFASWNEIAGDGSNLPVSKEKLAAKEKGKPRMNIIIPMAGLGSRFRQAGYTTPKPLIEVLGRPMYAWATESLPLNHASSLIFVLLRSQPEYPMLRADILRRYAKHNPVVLDVPELTAGQAVTVLTADSLIDNDRELLIHNADTAFEIKQDWVTAARAKKADGALLVFDSMEKRWSFSREGADGWVEEVREKVVICNHASTGTYYFRQGRDFVRLAKLMIAQRTVEKGEYYVGPLYNDLIAEGGKVRNYQIDRLYCFGTPEDLTATLKEIEARR